MEWHGELFGQSHRLRNASPQPERQGERLNFWVDRRPTGSWPETGLEEINGDLLEEDFWPGMTSG